jgi:hypothetical protein
MGSFQTYVTMLMSFMPGPNGPPYSICDCNTFNTGN